MNNQDGMQTKKDRQMSNPIEAALIAARDAFDRYARHHLAQWQSIKDDPAQTEQAAKRWRQYRENVELGAKMREASDALVVEWLNHAQSIEAINRLLSWEAGGGHCSENVAFARDTILKYQEQK